MNQERKVSVLRQLLERVQRRAAALPVSVSASSAQSSKPPARPGSATSPVDFGSGGESVHPPHAVAEPPFLETARAPEGAISDGGGASQPESESEQGPPSAPRLRELPEEDGAADERDVDDEETQIKTPPPESGRQHVTPSPSATVTEPDEDISITVTMEESEAPPPISPSPPAASVPLINRPRVDMPDVSGPQPRLALVSEPEIELHGMTPLSAMAETLAPASPLKPPAVAAPTALSAPVPLRPQDIELAVVVPPPAAPSVPPATPSGIRPVPPTPPGTSASPATPAPSPPPPAPASPFARTAPSVPDTKPSVSAPAASAAPPIRLMAEPLADAPHEPSAPVEVWASTFAPAALRAQVASFVGQNANFERKTFGELVRASLALGEDKP